MEQDKVIKLSDVDKKVWSEDATSGKYVKPEYKPSYGERWNKTRPTKMTVFWVVAASMILTMIVGFNWGGWVTGGTAQEMTNEAITQRLSLICVGQFYQDPQKEQKLTELKETGRYQQDKYVKDNGWATMPGEVNPNNQVAQGCANLIVQSNQ